MARKKKAANQDKKTILNKSFLSLLVFLIPYLLIKLGDLSFFLIANITRILIFPLTILNTLFSRSAKLKIVIISFIVLFSFYSFALAKLISALPSPDLIKTTARPSTTEIYDRRGNLLYQIYEGRNQQKITLDKVPKDLINATIAIEDRHFYTHPGIDLIGIFRALKYNYQTGGMQGASTITQQLIKNTLLNPEKTYQRKIKEIILAFWAERIYTKQEILEMYFNEVPYGGPSWGIEAAAQMYFNKKTIDLSLAESTYLAGLPASPTQFSPFGIHPELGKNRQSEVLRRMAEDGYVSQAEAEKALKEELTFKPQRIAIEAPHFVMYVRSLLSSRYGEGAVAQGGLKVTTTLDLNLQHQAEEILAKEVNSLNKLNVQNGGLMVTDAKTGQILSMVGSKDYFDPKGGNFNVTLSPRPPGSSIKVVTYATAFKEGFTPATILLDTPTTFPNPYGKAYSPVNYDGSFHGPVTIRQALGSSYNIPAVKLLSLIGMPKMLQTAKDMGITTLNKPEDYGLSLTLGGAGTTMVDMMSVYGTLASGGIRRDPEAIIKVEDSDGHILEEGQQFLGRRVLPEEVAYLLTDILSDRFARAPAFGTPSLLEIPGYSVAVKTGTSDNKRDNWTFGYTPEYVVGVWVGNNNNSPMDPKLSSGITGAAPIWHKVMVALLQDKPDRPFAKPEGIVDISVDGRRDLGIKGLMPKSVVSYQKTKQKDEDLKEKDVITYSDPFGTYTPKELIPAL